MGTKSVTFTRRLAITLLVPILFGVASYFVPSPGIDIEFLDSLKIPRGVTGPFALGVLPTASAYILVELVAAIGWRRLRHGGPMSRQKLERWIPLVTLILAGFQAFGVALYIRGLGDGSPLSRFDPLPGRFDQLVFWLGLCAGACVALLAARAVTAAGLANGVVLLVLARVPQSVLGSGTNPEKIELATRDIGLCAATLVLVVVASIVALWARKSWVPIPASSLQPLMIGASAVSVPELLASLGVISRPFQVGSDVTTSWVTTATVTLVVTLAFAYLFQRPARVAKTLHISSTRASSELLRALPPTLAFLIALTFASHVLVVRFVTLVSVATLVLLVAVLFDLTSAIRAHRTHANLVHVADEHRPYALPLLEQAFRDELIELYVLQRSQHALLRVFGPFVPTALWVRRGDASAARDLLKRFRAGKLELEVAKQPERGWRFPLLAVLGLLAATMAFVPREPARTPGVTLAKLEVVRVDDDEDAFVLDDDEALPPGVSIVAENAPIGLEETNAVHFARLVAKPEEGSARAIERVRPWILRHTPVDRRIAFGSLDELNEETNRYETTAFRSYVLTGEPILTNAHVKRAEAVRREDGSVVSIELSEEGALRFGQATREWTRRRIAILIDDQVTSAPVVLSEIAGGRVQITMGSNDPDVQYAEATKLAGALSAD